MSTGPMQNQSSSERVAILLEAHVTNDDEREKRHEAEITGLRDDIRETREQIREHAKASDASIRRIHERIDVQTHKFTADLSELKSAIVGRVFVLGGTIIALLLAIIGWFVNKGGLS